MTIVVCRNCGNLCTLKELGCAYEVKENENT